MIDSFIIALAGLMASSTLFMRYYINRNIRIIGQAIPVLYSTSIYLYDDLIGMEIASRAGMLRLAFLAWFIVIIFYFFLDLYEDRTLKLCRRKDDLL